MRVVLVSGALFINNCSKLTHSDHSQRIIYIYNQANKYYPYCSCLLKTDSPLGRKRTSLGFTEIDKQGSSIYFAKAQPELFVSLSELFRCLHIRLCLYGMTGTSLYVDF